MPFFLENFGLEELYEDEEVLESIEYEAFTDGRSFLGYYPTPYIYKDFGRMELVLCTEDDDEEEELLVSDVSMHAKGTCLWETVLSDINANPKGFDKMRRHVLVDGANGMKGLMCVDLRMADVLPGFCGGEVVKMQVIGFPATFRLYEDEDSYMEDQAEWNGGRLGLEDGFIMPTGLLKNHNPDDPHFEEKPDYDCLHTVRGTITKVFWGKLRFSETEIDNIYVHTWIQTRHGELELVHSLTQIEEEDVPLLKSGSIFSGVVYLSGDVAVEEYRNGRVLDGEHNYSLVAWTLSGGDPERLRWALADDCVYSAGTVNEEYRGIETIIARLKFVQETTDAEYDVLKGHIRGDVNGRFDIGSPGTRCLVMSNKASGDILGFCTVETREDGRISRIETFPDNGQAFDIDPRPELKDPEEDEV